MELDQKVAGHQIVDLAMKHYLRPQRERLRRARAEKTPALPTEGSPVQAERDDLMGLLKSANEQKPCMFVAEALKRLSA